jgi:asparagine synthase (glutamine-hydrolysing)
MREARASGIKVMLDGQGADELLCGYERYVPVWALETARRGGVLAAVRGFVRLAHGSRPGLWGMTALAAYVLQPRLRRRVLTSRAWFLHRQYLECVLDVLARISKASRNLHDARLADIASFSLPALLRFEDRNSMAHSIEARVPYVDRAVVCSALRLPDIGLLRDGFTKYPLRVLAASVLPPDIAWRRSKVGFEPPTQSWLAALGQRMQAEVEQSSLIRRQCTTVPRLTDQPSAVQWRMYNLARWQNLFAVAVD